MLTVTLTINPDVAKSILYGDPVLLSYISPTACTVHSVRTLSEYVLTGLYIKRTEPASHILWQSWKDWGFPGRPQIKPGWVLEVEVVWWGEDDPPNDRVAVLELEEQ